VRENRVGIARLPLAFDGFTVLHLTDLHLDMRPDMPHVLAERVRDVDYDVAVITGDFRARTHGPWRAALDGLEQVRAQLADPVYAVLGNHDSLRMVPRMEAMGIRVLLNESIAIARGDEAIHIAGIDDPHYFGVHNMEKAAAGIPEQAVAILLAHSPEIYRQAAHAGFALMLSGHTHGGQICLPGGLPLYLNARCPRRFCRGAWRYHDLHGYTSVGSGVSVVDVRLNCPPEITLHRLRAG
jgi:predicted MPP superfamily phosphohydrolase